MATSLAIDFSDSPPRDEPAPLSVALGAESSDGPQTRRGRRSGRAGAQLSPQDASRERPVANFIRAPAERRWLRAAAFPRSVGAGTLFQLANGPYADTLAEWIDDGATPARSTFARRLANFAQRPRGACRAPTATAGERFIVRDPTTFARDARRPRGTELGEPFAAAGNPRPHLPVRAPRSEGRRGPLGPAAHDEDSARPSRRETREKVNRPRANALQSTGFAPHPPS